MNLLPGFPAESFVRTLAALSLAGVLLCGSGCGTIRSFSTSEELWLYSGTRANIAVWSPTREWTECTGLSGLVALVDLPWSLLVDTVLAPLTLPLEVIVGGGKGTKAPSVLR